MLVAEPDTLISIPGTDVVEEKNQLLHVILTSTHMLWLESRRTHNTCKVKISIQLTGGQRNKHTYEDALCSCFMERRTLIGCCL